jgi:hypothetical protein
MSLNRRQILKGFSLGASTMVLSPIVARLEAEAAGVAAQPQRFVFVVEGNGCNFEQVQPLGIERKREDQREKLVDLSLADYELPKALEPLAPLKDRLTIIQGLSGRVCGGGHSNNFGALGVYSGKAGAAGETVDGALAQKLGGIFPHVGLGITDRPEHTVVYNISASGPGKKLPIQCHPDLAYSALFGSVGEGEAKQAFAARNNLLDYMIDDVKRLENRLAGAEREKLQVYLQSFEAMRDRQSRLNEIEATLRKHAPAASDKYTSSVEADRLDAHFDIGAAALISGLTNVLTIASGCGDPYFSVRFTGLGINFDKHSIGHGGSYEGRTWEELAVAIRRYHFELIARLAEKLASVPEGDGTMLDNTVIVYLSDAAESHHSRCWQWPVVVLGNVGGRLKTGGRYLDYPYYAKPGHRTMANFYTTLLAAAGEEREHFGLVDPQLKDFDQRGPLAELVS